MQAALARPVEERNQKKTMRTDKETGMASPCISSNKCKENLLLLLSITSCPHSSQHSGMSATAQTMYLRLQEQQAEIEALQRQFELKAALLSEREETIVMQRERYAIA